jgi:hypothetical protein
MMTGALSLITAAPVLDYSCSRPHLTPHPTHTCVVPGCEVGQWLEVLL